MRLYDLCTALLFVALAALKLTDGLAVLHEPGEAVAITCEVVLAVLWAARRCPHVAAFASIVFGASVCAYAFAHTGSVACRCLGPVMVDRIGRVGVASVLVAVGSVRLLLTHSTSGTLVNARMCEASTHDGQDIG